MNSAIQTLPAPGARIYPMLPRPARIMRRIRETDDTFTLELKAPPGFDARPGQFNMLYVHGLGEAPLSISRWKPPSTLVHTIRKVGEVTTGLSLLGPGDHVGLRGPFGTAWPLDAAEGRDVVIAAGGIGLAPLRPAIEHILQHRDRYDRFVILYGARTPEGILYPDDLARWRGRLDTQVLVSVDHAPRNWRGNVGVITTLVRDAHFDPGRAIVMTCGPEMMMFYVMLEMRQRGVDVRDIHVSMERNMKCAIAQCGRCQFGPHFICRDGPVFPFAAVEPFYRIREL